MANLIPLAIADVELQLSAAVAVGGTTLTLNSANDDDGNALPAGMYCFTLDSGTSNKEYLIGQLNGVNVTGVKSVSRQGVETTGAARSHRVGAPCIITNFATLQRVADILRGQLPLDGANPVAYDDEPSLGSREELATVGYVLDTVSGGTVVFDQQVITGNAGESVVAGNLVYFKTSDQEWYKTDADTVATVEGVQLGIALGTGSDGASISGGIQIAGTYTTTGLTAGATYYASNTAGAIASSAGTNSQIIGLALSTTKLLLIPRNPQTLSTNEKAALAGGGDLGVPSLSNQFVTETGFPFLFSAENAENETNLGFVVGPMAPTYVKPRFVKHLSFGQNIEIADGYSWVANDLANDIDIVATGAQAYFFGTSTASLFLNLGDLRLVSGQMNYSVTTEPITLDWFARLPSNASVGDILMGFGENTSLSYTNAYTDTVYSRIMFAQDGANLYAVVTKRGVGTTATNVTSGVTLSNFNNYRIDLIGLTSAKFYINGVLVHTDNNTTNFPDSSSSIGIGFGRSSTETFYVMAPTISIDL